MHGDWTPVKGTTVDVRDIVTPMMHDDVMFHLVSVYIRLHCASLSAVLVFEAEQSYSRYRLGCGRIMRIERIFKTIQLRAFKYFVSDYS